MIRPARWVAAGVAAGLLAAPAAAADPAPKVKEGDPFPVVPLAAAQVEKLAGKKEGDTVSIADLKGKKVVVFFYPKALTPGCTVESCGFRDLADKFPKDVVLLGASADAEKKQDEFIAKEKLPYPLLCDTDLKLIKELGIQNGDRPASQRVTFVVDKDGKIAKIYTKVDVKTHPEEVLKFVESVK